MNPALWVARHGRLRPDAPALADGERVHADWATFAARTAGAAAGLRDDFGLSPGDRVAIVMRNRPEYLEAMFAIWHAGLVAVPVNARLHRDEIAYILSDSGTSVVVTDPEHAGDVESPVVVGDRWEQLAASSPAPLADRRPDDPAWLFYTSGTTGRPKGATLTNRNLLVMTLSYYADIDAVRATGLHPADRTAVARRGAVRAAACRSRSGQRVRRDRRSRRPAEALAGDVVLRRAHHGQAAARRRRPVEPEDDHLRRRADVPGGSGARPRPLRSPPGPDLRPGRDADDDHRVVESRPRRRQTAIACRASASPAPMSRSASSTTTIATFPPARSAKSWSGATW